MKLFQILTLKFILVFMMNVEFCSCSTQETPKEYYQRLRKLYNRIVTTENKDIFSSNCKASVEETLSWLHLRKLFEKYDNEREGGVLKQVWPRPKFYDKVLEEVLKDDAREKSDKWYWCDWWSWTENPDERYYNLCQEGSCMLCGADLWSRTDDQKFPASLDPKYLSVCHEGLEEPVEEVDQIRLKQVEESLIKPRVAFPGKLTFDETMAWINSKFINKEMQFEEWGPCDAPRELELSLSYLYALSIDKNSGTYLSEPQVKSTEWIRRDFNTHLEFYEEKLQWLKGADLSIVPCGPTLFCGWDGVCQMCSKVYEDKCTTKAPDEISKWEEVNGTVKTNWSSPTDALKSWLQVYNQIVNKSVGKDVACSSSEEQSLSWTILWSLIEDNLLTGILKYAWPRIREVDKRLDEVMKAGSEVVFCQKGFSCSNATCQPCNKRLCSANDFIFKIINVKRDAEIRALEILKGSEGQTGDLTLDEALAWNKTFARTAVKVEWDSCDTNEHLSLAQKLLVRKLMVVQVAPEGYVERWEWRSKEQVEIEMHAELYEDLRWLKRMDKSRGFCGFGLVCGYDGLCISCKKVENQVDKNDKNEASEVIQLWNICQIDSDPQMQFPDPPSDLEVEEDQSGVEAKKSLGRLFLVLLVGAVLMGCG